jgi:hypothetical protein
MKIRVISAGDAEARPFLDGANEAFGHWGDEVFFDWAFRRVMAGRAADLLYLEDESGRTIAGSAITYRRLPDRLAAIIAGSWTRAEARGRGAFSRMLEATRDRARESGAVVLGFGRMENASRRRFDAVNAGMHPTYYCRSLPVEQRMDLDVLDPALLPSSFVYTEEEWRSQFLERPGARVECVGRRGEWSAIIEHMTDFDRVHAISDESALPQLAARRLFWYSCTKPSMACEWTEGFLSTLPALTRDWQFQNGDRM